MPAASDADPGDPHDPAHDDETPTELSRAVEGRPLYGRRRGAALRFVVLLAVAAMILPVIANLVTVSAATAATACARAVAYAAPDASGSSARFEFFGAGLVGWECYSVGGFSSAHHIVSLGLVPGMVDLPRGVDARD